MPPARPRAGGAVPTTSEKYARYETVELTLAAVATVQEVGQFSGTPDAIDVWCSASGILVRLRDLAQREESSFTTTANTTIETRVSRRIVEAQDAAGVGGQIVRATGKWAAPRE
jgi:hypothetical protein